MDDEQYAWRNLTGSEKKGKMRFGCVHHGRPRDTRKVDNPNIYKSNSSEARGNNIGTESGRRELRV